MGFQVLVPNDPPKTGYEPEGRPFEDFEEARDAAFTRAGQLDRRFPATCLVLREDSSEVWSVSIVPGMDGAPTVLRVVHDDREQPAMWSWKALNEQTGVRRPLTATTLKAAADELDASERAELHVEVGDFAGPPELTEATVAEVLELAGGQS